jgi:hypothetical protein
MQTIATKIAAARVARRHRVAEQSQLLWEERRRAARRAFPAGPFGFRNP